MVRNVLLPSSCGVVPYCCYYYYNYDYYHYYFYY